MSRTLRMLDGEKPTMRNRTSSYSAGVLEQIKRANSVRGVKSFRSLIISFGHLARMCHFCQKEDNVVPVICSHGNWLFLCEDCFDSGKVELTVTKKDAAPKIHTDDCPCYRILAEKLMEKEH